MNKIFKNSDFPFINYKSNYVRGEYYDFKIKRWRGKNRII